MLFLFPFFSWALLLLIISYINHIGPNPRIKKIENILKRGTDKKKTELKYQLQNECVMSIGFVFYTFILSILAVDYARNTEKHLHKEVSNYFHFDTENLILRLIYSLSFIPLVQDGVIMVSMILSLILSPWMVLGIVGFIILSSTIIMPISILRISANYELFLLLLIALVVVCLVVVCLLEKKRRKKRKKKIAVKSTCEYSGTRWWTFCAYSLFFPLACVLNHLNYIIIAFTFNLYHATSIALIYGVVGIFIYVMLDRLPYSLQFFKSCKNPIFCKNKKWMSIFVFCKNKKWMIIFVLKALAVIVLGLYVAFDGVIYYFVPIDISFDVFGNNFLSIYNTVIVFLTALVAYVLIQKSYQSPISIFSKARDKIEKDKEIGQDGVKWEDMTEEEKDIDSAIKLWEKVIPETTITTTTTTTTTASDSNLTTTNPAGSDDITSITTPSNDNHADTTSSDTDFKDLGADDNIKMVRLYEVNRVNLDIIFSILIVLPGSES